MRELYLPVAASLAVLIGVAHSYLGERYILQRLFRRELPKLFGSDWFTKRTLRFAWHLTSVAWWGFAALLFMLPPVGGEGARQTVLWVVVGVFGVSAVAALVGSRGRHLSWVVFLAIALLAASAAYGAPSETSSLLADVVSVATDGEPGAYGFAVGISSADTGCGQYANWWEVVGLDGELLYRRILTHSHITEQPFVRRGGPVALSAETVVWVRAYMHPTGYGGAAFRGSVAEGFLAKEPVEEFALELASQEPLPKGCAH